MTNPYRLIGVDKNGNEFKYGIQPAKRYSNGTCVYELENGRVGLVNKDGVLITDPIYERIFLFNKWHNAIAGYHIDGIVYETLLSIEGKTLLPMDFTMVQQIHHNYAVVHTDKCGIIELSTQQFIMPLLYNDHIELFKSLNLSNNDNSWNDVLLEIMIQTYRNKKG